MKTRALKILAATKLLALLFLLVLPATVQAQDAYSTNADGSIYTYSTNADGSANIVAYAGPPWVVTIPTNLNGLTVTSIGESAFQNTNLTSVTIPNSVTSIGDGAFEDCISLTSVTIPNSVTSIGAGAFLVCHSLTSITADASNPAYSSMNGVLFDKAQATLLEFPGGLGGSYTIPNSVSSIGNTAFGSCTSLTSVTIPNSVTSIGAGAFASCTSLTNVTIPNSVTSIGLNAFGHDSGLTSVTIPNGVTSIGYRTFVGCTSLTSVTIPGSVTNIGQEAFIDCYNLTNAIINNGVTSIGIYAFYQCTSLTSVTIPNSVTSIGSYAFVNCVSLTSITIPNDLTNCGDAFLGSSLTNVTFANGTTSIVPYEFTDCTSLTSITIPNSVTSIGYGAFEFCPSLTSVTIPSSVISIGQYAFEDCYGLTKVYFTGNAPSPTNDSTVFSGDPATVYYLPGTTGWGAMFDGLPTAPWFLPNPVILNNSPGFGVQPGGFGFTISWATNASVVVEAATNLANPVWIPVSTDTLTGGTNYFSDPQWTNYPSRFYRAARAYTVGGTLTGLPAGDTVTLQDNGSDNLTLSNNGTFTFPTALPDGHAYSVTVSGTSGGTLLGPLSLYDFGHVRNGSGTISGANVTDVVVPCAAITGNPDLDMYNAAVADGTANGGVPAVMFTENGGPFRVTAAGQIGSYSRSVAGVYAGWAVFTHVVGTTSCSSTTLSSWPYVIQFGSLLECGFGPYGY